VNRNQGAESTLAYLLSEVHNAEVQSTPFEKRQVAAASA